MPSRCAEVPGELRRRRRWVCADDGSKRPMSAVSKHPASIVKPTTWSDFDEAREAVEGGKHDWLGYVFSAGDGLVGIDIDIGFDDLGLPTAEAMEAIRACNSYTEVSKSGRGFHIICEADLPAPGLVGDGWEAYKDGRFFVLTGHILKGYEEVRPAQEAVDAILKRHMGKTLPEASTKGKQRSKAIWRPVWPDWDGDAVPLEPTWPIVTSGARHLSLVSFCGAQLNAGCSERQLQKLARAVNETSLKPPLPESEVASVVKSCIKYRR